MASAFANPTSRDEVPIRMRWKRAMLSKRLKKRINCGKDDVNSENNPDMKTRLSGRIRISSPITALTDSAISALRSETNLE